MQTSCCSLLILFKFHFNFMSIDSFFKRLNKVIDDEPTPECSPHPSESSGSTTVIPATQVTPLQRQQQQKEQPDNSLLSRSQTLSIGLADAEEKEEESESKQAPGAPKKEHPMRETELMLLLTPMRPFQPDPRLTTMMTAFLLTLHELHEAKQKARERKRWLQQLLL